MATMMVGLFAVASTFAAERSKGILRRLKITPFSGAQLIVGQMVCFLTIGVLAIVTMTGLAIAIFDFNQRGEWLMFGGFIVLALIMMLGFGLAIGGRAKSTTQAEMFGQIVFMVSLAFSGVWFPRALLPDFLRSITEYLPLVPVIDGIRMITTESAGITDLGPQLLVILAWTASVYVLGIYLFRWE